MTNEYYEKMQDEIETDEAMTLFINMLRQKYSVHYYHDAVDQRLIVIIETILDPTIKITDEIGCRHVYFDKYGYVACDTRYELDRDLFYNFTPKELADLIEKDFKAAVAKEVK